MSDDPNQMILTDAHCHLQDPAFVSDISEVIKRATLFGIRHFAVNGTSPADWSQLAELANKTPEVIPLFGVHPWKVEERSENGEEHLKAMLIRFPKAGIGEIGLDGLLTDAPMDLQVQVFRQQLKISRQFKRPCTIHAVKAWSQLLPVLKESPPPKFLLHSFGGSAEQVGTFLKWEAYFSFGGAVIRHSNSQKVKEALQTVPADRLLLETDAPFQHPEGKDHRQEPAGLLKIAEAVAEVRGEPIEDLLKNCEENAKNFFEVPIRF